MPKKETSFDLKKMNLNLGACDISFKTDSSIFLTLPCHYFRVCNCFCNGDCM